MSTLKKDGIGAAAASTSRPATPQEHVQPEASTSSDAMLSVAPPPYTQTEPLLPQHAKQYHNYGSSAPSIKPSHNFPQGPTTLPPTGSTFQHDTWSSPQAISFDSRLMQEADHRARKRFFGAFVWAIMIWLIVGMLAGGISTAAVNQANRGRHRHHQGDDWSAVAVAASDH
ncbi:hypothetical protein OIO90_001643 [Microbotryomycetes sp. JL221]|nr:hypothetical protein OIO90_001643 [Microbotryomycetes sp. JL221]